jgi:predicted CXXCH cytochrome family protein
MVCTMKHLLKSSLFSALVLLISWTVANSTTTEKEKCITCHDKVYDKAIDNKYIHRPFLNKQCPACHVDENRFSSTHNNHQSSRQEKGPEITWLEKHYEPAGTHYFLVPSVKVDDTLYVQTKVDNNKAITTSLTLPPIEQLSQLANDSLQPKIFDIQFLGVKRGILYSATISWMTDEPSDSQIHYGIDSLNLKSRLDQQLKSLHTMDITPLIPGKIYNYSVVSTDLHGNKTISQPMSFSTETIAQMVPSTQVLLNEQSSSSLEELNHQLLALGEQYFIVITAQQPTYMNIGSNRYLRPRIKMPAANANQPMVPIKHVKMLSNSATNMSTCMGCHGDYQTAASHPINVRPKQGMTFPAEYPLLDDGRMHCMTCHDEHASNIVARLRRPKRELCISCHNEYG